METQSHEEEQQTQGLGVPWLCPPWNPESLEPLGSASASGQDFDGLVDELQQLGFQALSEPSASVVSQRLVCHSCSRAASVESL